MPAPALTEDDRRELLRIARATLREVARSGGVPPGRPHRASLLAPAAVFIRLSGDDARGCAGTATADRALYRAVQEQAIAAAEATAAPVTVPTIPSLRIEISVLGPLEPCAGPGDLRVGTHGVALACRGRRSLLLPQVARERGFTARQLLEAVCAQAGLEPSAWSQPGAELTRFAATVFDDGSPPRATP